MKYIIKSLFLLLLFSCTEEFIIHTENTEPVVVIYGELTNEIKHQSVKITWSSPYFDSQPNTGVSGATVKIIDSNDRTYELFENDMIPGLYETKTRWAAKTGVTYSLKVDVDLDGDIKTYEASTTILPLLEVDSIKLELDSIMGFKHYSLKLYAYEPTGEDFYLCKYTIRDTLVSSKISQYLMFDDVLFDGQYIDGYAMTFFETQENLEDIPEELEDQSVYLAPGDKVEVQISRISKAYFDFVSQCQSEMHGSNPFFGGPPANITTNILNGGTGYFTGYCIDRVTAITPQFY